MYSRYSASRAFHTKAYVRLFLVLFSPLAYIYTLDLELWCAHAPPDQARIRRCSHCCTIWRCSCNLCTRFVLHLSSNLKSIDPRQTIDSHYQDRLELKSATDRTLGLGILEADSAFLVLTAATMIHTQVDMDVIKKFNPESAILSHYYNFYAYILAHFLLLQIWPSRTHQIYYDAGNPLWLEPGCEYFSLSVFFSVLK
jgi:hypothetical protein